MADWFKVEDVHRVLIDLGYLEGSDPISTVKPTHGSCCTCQDCGYYHDECVCSHNELLFELAKILNYKGEH